MTHHAEYYAKKNLENRSYDKSTVYDGSTEEPHEHPNFPKPQTAKWFNVIVVPACIWAVLALINAQYNIGQGLKPQNWELMNGATTVLFMYWSAKVFEWLANIDYKNNRVKMSAFIGVCMCCASFVAFGLWLFKIIVELFIK